MALEALSNVLSRVADRIRSRTDYETRKADQLAEEQRREAAVVRAEDRAESRAKRLREFDADLEFESFKRLDTEQQYRKAEQLGVKNARSMSPGELGIRVREKLNEMEAEKIKSDAMAKYDATEAIRKKDATKVVDPAEVENASTNAVVENGPSVLAALARTIEIKAQIDDIAGKEPDFAQFIQQESAKRQQIAKSALEAHLKEIDRSSGDPKVRAATLENEVMSIAPGMAPDMSKIRDPMQKVAMLENLLRSNAAVWAEKQNLLPDDKGQSIGAVAQLKMIAGTDNIALQALLQEQYALSKDLLKFGVMPGVPLDQQQYLPQQAKDHLQKIGAQKTLMNPSDVTPESAPSTSLPASNYGITRTAPPWLSGAPTASGGAYLPAASTSTGASESPMPSPTSSSGYWRPSSKPAISDMVAGTVPAPYDSRSAQQKVSDFFSPSFKSSLTPRF